MNYYLENGYINMRAIMSLPYPFIFVVHGRGTGKTFGACRELLEQGKTFMLLRRQQTEADLIGNTEFSPFQPVIDMEGRTPLYVGSLVGVKNIRGIWNGVIDEKGQLKPEGAPIGYIGALATISSIRGFNGEIIKTIVYDEFIPEKTSRPIKAEGEAVLQCYETINRNRELKGEPPLKMVFLSNANKLSSPVFDSFGITNYVDRMVQKKQESCFLQDRGIAILLLKDSPISRKKADTALYRAAASKNFSEMSLANTFDSNTYLYVNSEPLQEYILIAQYEDCYIYRHKSESGKYYVCKHKTGSTKRIYLNEDFSKRKFKKDLTLFFVAWSEGKVSFQNFDCKNILTNALK